MRETHIETPPSSPVAAAPDRDRYEPEVYEPSPRWRWLYDRFFSQIQVDERWEPTVRSAAERGTVIYIARSLSFLDFLAVDYLTKQHGLPLVRFCNDVGMSIVEPFGRGSRRLRRKAQIPEDEALRVCLGGGHSALLFLRRPPSLAEQSSAGGARKGEALEHDLIRTLVQEQRRASKPILIVPQTFVWTKRPPNQERSAVDLLFGPAEWPGTVRSFSQFLVNSKNALLRSGEVFDVGEFLRQHDDLTDAQAADAIRYLLLRRMERERALVLGPAKKTAARLQGELLRSPRVRQHIEQAARESKLPIHEVEADARKELDHLCAAMDTNVVDLFHRGLERVWNQIYDGLVVDEEGMERLRDAARKGPLILLPSHKSHVDYLIISDVMWSHGLAPPLIAAGENLSFWPLGPFLRHSGAFFIKRSFKGKKLYAQLVDAYIRKILVEGWNIELFVEGGRSRTGKLLPPKLGILSMIVDAALKLREREISLVPISIGYERIIEEGDYVRENAGGEKEPESIQGLLGARRVLRSRYGRLYLSIGEIFSFRELTEEARSLATRTRASASADPGSLTPAQRRALVQRIAHRVTYEINRVTIVTPAALTATVLLANRRRGIAHADLLAQARAMVRTLRRLGARLVAPVVDDEGELRADAVSETVRLFEDGKLVTCTVIEDPSAETFRRRARRRRDGAKREGAKGEIERGEPIYAVPDDKRIALEYHKNTVLHFFVPSALIATSLRSLGDEARLDVLRERVRALSRVFKYEFMYRADADFDAIFSDALSGMCGAGELAQSGDVVRRAGGEGARAVVAYAEMLPTYLEAYRLAIRCARPLGEEPVARKEWIKQALALGQRLYFAGEITLRESVSRPKLENALLLLHDQHLVRLEGEEMRGATRDAGADTLDDLDRLLAAHLDAR